MNDKNRCYNKKAYENHIRRVGKGNNAGTIILIILMSLSFLSFLILSITEDIKYPYVCMLVLFGIGDYILIQYYLEEEQYEKRMKENKQVENKFNK